MAVVEHSVLRSKAKFLGLLLIGVAVSLGGCSIGESQPDESKSKPKVSAGADASADLEQIITQGLPKEIQRLDGISVYVQQVSCVHAGGNSLNCLAEVARLDGVEPAVENMAIDGTCDAVNCMWEVR